MTLPVRALRGHNKGSSYNVRPENDIVFFVSQEPMEKQPPIPRETATTSRQAIREVLLDQPRSALEISQLLALPEKEVLAHLNHLARAPGPGLHFQITPAACKSCGFIFRKRERLTSPSRCPVCRHESIRRPRFALAKKK
ncbi:MAG: transcriptional regulator [Thermodesulfobacteriota bacterium]